MHYSIENIKIVQSNPSKIFVIEDLLNSKNRFILLLFDIYCAVRRRRFLPIIEIGVNVNEIL